MYFHGLESLAVQATRATLFGKGMRHTAVVGESGMALAEIEP